MRIELTVRGPDGCRDVAVSAPAPVPFETVAAAMLSAAGIASRPAVVWSGEQPLPATALLGDPGLRTGGLLTLDGPRRSPELSAVLSLQVVSGPAAGRVVALHRGRLRIGRAPECDLVLCDDRVSRVHATIDVAPTSIIVRDVSSTNGTHVDNVAVPPTGTPLRVGQLIGLGDSLLVLRGPDDTPATLTSSAGAVLVNRAPRRVERVADDVISLPAPVDAERPRPVQWLTAALPAAAGGAVAWLTHSPVFLLFALLSPIMVLSGALGDRLHWRRTRRRAAVAYRSRRGEADAQVAAGLAAETGARRTNGPDPATVWRMASAPASRLWERRRGDDDQLLLRVGRSDRPARLRVADGTGTRSAGVVHAVPLYVDLRAGPVGLTGPADAVAGLARWLVTQLAALHSPADVDLALLLAPDRSADWAWARWLPHLGTRVATSRDQTQALLAAITAVLDRRRSVHRPPGNRWTGRWTVLVVDRAAVVADLPAFDALLADGAALGLGAICIDADPGALPKSCAQTARVSGDTGTNVTVRRSDGCDDAVTDHVSMEWAEQLARALAPYADASVDSAALPATCGLLDLLGMEDLDAGDVNARWSAATGRLDTVLGRSAEGPVHIDLVADGPHALIAGTTGAGKSELLQTLVAGLALAHPPEDVTFLLIDYKGGAAFAACADLPHTAGLVTDLDPHLTRRALRSLDAELRRREAALAAVGAADLEAYRRSGARIPVPRLVIVVDEFATLADELPDFVGGLVAVAQRGRSLGVHLILATQRPGAAVTPEIRANTSLRVALRVTDAGESNHIIDAPDAATIEPTTPGRAYLRAGTALTCFQTASVHEHESTAPGPRVDSLLDWRRTAASSQPSGGSDLLTRTVAALGSAARSEGRPPATSPWLPALPQRLDLRDVTDGAGRAVVGLPPPGVPIGRLDLPDEQAQPALEIDLGVGAGVLVVGRSGAGRTAALVTTALAAARRFGPHQLEIYVIDAGGTLVEALRPLPHLATAAGPADLATAATLLRRLRARMLRNSVAAATTSEAPVALLLVDSWDVLLAGQDDLDAVRCADDLEALLRGGSAAGPTVVVTGGRSLLAPRIAAGFGTRLLLDLHDRSDYGLAGINTRAVPSELPPGRGVRASDGAEFQLAVASADDARTIASRWSQVGGHASAIRLRPLPDRVGLGDLTPSTGRILIGLAGDDAAEVSIDPFAGAGRLLVAGPPRSGRSTLLRCLLSQATGLDASIIVAAPSRSPLAADAAALGMPVLGPTSEALLAPPDSRTLLLIDDSEAFVDTAVGEALCDWLRADVPVAAVVAGRCDDLATAYRGPGAEVRRHRCGILLRPGPVDGELLGVRLARRPAGGPTGRGLMVGEPSWGPAFEAAEPLPIQVAQP